MGNGGDRDHVKTDKVPCTSHACPHHSDFGVLGSEAGADWELLIMKTLEVKALTYKWEGQTFKL